MRYLLSIILTLAGLTAFGQGIPISSIDTVDVTGSELYLGVSIQNDSLKFAKFTTASLASYLSDSLDFVKLDRLVDSLADVESKIETYLASSIVMVKATGLGITATKSSGALTITVPSSVSLESFRFFGSSSDLQSGEIVVNIVGGYGSGTDFNTSDSNMYHPVITLQQRTVGPGSDFEQIIPRTGVYNIYHKVFTTSGTVSVEVSGLSGSFGLFGQF
mgnify:CR=1 FL=1